MPTGDDGVPARDGVGLLFRPGRACGDVGPVHDGTDIPPSRGKAIQSRCKPAGHPRPAGRAAAHLRQPGPNPPPDVLSGVSFEISRNSKMATLPITKRGAEMLKAELQRLKSVDRRAVITAIADARSHG